MLDELTRKFVIPVVQGYYVRYGWRFKNLDEGSSISKSAQAHEAINPAVMLCLGALKNYDPKFGTGFNYLTKIAAHCMGGLSGKEAEHQQRFVCASNLGPEDEPE